MRELLAPAGTPGGRRCAPGGTPVPPALSIGRVRQVHGAGVVWFGETPTGPVAEADAIAAEGPGAGLAVLVADCAAVALGTPEGHLAAVHAGWRGLLAGVIERSVQELRGRGGTRVWAAVGPCAGPCCYEFGPTDARPLADRFGGGVLASTESGRPALDLRAGVHRALEEAGAELDWEDAACTVCGAGPHGAERGNAEVASWYSHRAGTGPARQALFVWHRGDEPGSASAASSATRR